MVRFRNWGMDLGQWTLGLEFEIRDLEFGIWIWDTQWTFKCKLRIGDCNLNQWTLGSRWGIWGTWFLSKISRAGLIIPLKRLWSGWVQRKWRRLVSVQERESFDGEDKILRRRWRSSPVWGLSLWRGRESGGGTLMMVIMILMTMVMVVMMVMVMVMVDTVYTNTKIWTLKFKIKILKIQIVV